MNRISSLPVPALLRRAGAQSLLAVACLAALAACAPMPSGKQEFAAGRARLALPAGNWTDLGTLDAMFPIQPQTEGAVPVQARAVALRGAQQEVAAVLLVRTNGTNHPREPITWTARCPQQQGVTVQDRADASPVRIDCLRLKSWAHNKGWLDAQYPDLMKWVDAQQARPAKPYTHMHYRYGSETGAFVEVHALVDQRLLRPKPRNNEEFLYADLPALRWSESMAEAARLSTSMMDGFLAVPPFPLVPQ